MEKVNSIIAHLLAIQNFAKDIHYNCKGEAFYSKHLLCDRVAENIYDYIDSIKETSFLARMKEPLQCSEYLRNATAYIPDIALLNDEESFQKLASLIALTLEIIQDLKDLTIAEENLFGNIAENLQNSLGLLNRQVL